MIANVREFKICAAVKLLLVKILFEEVIFKVSFEGREERAVSERKRQQKNKRRDHHAVLAVFLISSRETVCLTDEADNNAALCICPSGSCMLG